MKKTHDYRQVSCAVDSQTHGYVCCMLSTAVTLSCRQRFTESWNLSECGFDVDRPLELSTTWCLFAGNRCTKNAWFEMWNVCSEWCYCFLETIII